MIAIDQVCQRLWLLLSVDHDQMLSFDVHSEFAITNKVHEAFIFFVVKCLIFRSILIFSRVPCWVNMSLILLLQVDHVRPRENTVKFAH